VKGGPGRVPGERAVDGAPGFTLVEVVVALLVFEVGVVGVAGLVALSGRLLGRAALTERAVYGAQQVVDSMADARPGGPGERAFPGGRLRWSSSDAGRGLRRVRVQAVDSAGRTLLSLTALLSPPGGAARPVTP